ncbi:MAG: hypothetical protein P8179_22375 [Candidatus Thiodiazotropha sp.]
MPLFIVIGGLLILTLILASIAQRYHDYVEQRRLEVKRILMRVSEVEDLVRRMVGLPVPVEVVQLLRQDILARLQIAKQIYAGYKGIDSMILGARTALAQVKPTTHTVELDYLRMQQLTRALGEMLWLLKGGRLLTSITEEQRVQLMEKMTMQRAETLYNYHSREAAHLEKLNQLHQAHWHCTQLDSLLKPLIPTHQKVEVWYQEMQPICERIAAKLSGTQVDVPPSESE